MIDTTEQKGSWVLNKSKTPDPLFAPATSDWRRYYLTDANHNVTTTIRFDKDNRVANVDPVTRYVYTPYGSVTEYGANWTGNSAEIGFDGPRYCGYFSDVETGLYQVRNRYYDPGLSTWISRDPVGYSAGNNLYAYCDGRPTGLTDPTGLEHLPSDARGTWIEGTRGNGVFQYANTPLNREAGIAGLKVRYSNNYIGIGGFPAEFYYGGNAANASVPIDVVKGTTADFTAADRAMQEKLGNSNWKRPAGYTWNHAGEPGSKIMELVKTGPHMAVAHEGPASVPRAFRRGQRVTARGMAALTVYTTLRDALQASGIAQPDYQVIEAEYYFLAKDGSVFTVQLPGWFGLFSSPKRTFIAGPRAGQTETITNADVAAYRSEGEAAWGQYIPGSLFREPRFIPGTQRSRLPLWVDGLQAGYIDEEGVHRYRQPFL